MKKTIQIFLLLLAVAHPAFAATDDLSSIKRGAGSVVPGSLGSTLRAGPQSSDDMLNTNAPNPASALSTDNMTSSDPMLSTTQRAPASALTTSSKTGSKMDPSFCNALIKHTPSADVAYQPGVDMNGKKVAPADVPGSPQVQLPNKIDIPLTVNLAKTLNLDTTKYPYNTLGSGTEAWLGTLSVEGDKVTFNGKPLSDEQQDNLAVLCMKQK
jgi:hypothetical protein